MQTAVDEFEQELEPLVQRRAWRSGTPRSTRATRTSSSSWRRPSASTPCSPSASATQRLVEADRSGDADGELARRVRLARLASEAGQRDRALAERIVESEAQPRIALLAPPRPDRRPRGQRQRDRQDPARLDATAPSAARPGTPRSRSARRPRRTCASSRTCATRPRARSATATTSSCRSTLEELDEGWLLEPARRARGAARGHLGAREGGDRRRASARASASPPGEPLQPWDYADAFFQDAPHGAGRPARGGARARSTRSTVARAYFGALGDDVDGVLERSDLYPRDGKNQHAFCIRHRPPPRRARARELRAGRALARRRCCTSSGTRVYDLAIDRDLPWLLRQPAHTFTTEAIAMLHGRARARRDVPRALRARRRPRSRAIRATPRCSAASCSSSRPGCRS